jgi:uncharacterized coiled-coil protein SlyX
MTPEEMLSVQSLQNQYNQAMATNNALSSEVATLSQQLTATQQQLAMTQAQLYEAVAKIRQLHEWAQPHYQPPIAPNFEPPHDGPHFDHDGPHFDHGGPHFGR